MTNKSTEFGGRALIVELLESNKQALHPGKGAENAQLVRRVCKHYGLKENDFLPRHMLKDKKGWGL